MNIPELLAQAKRYMHQGSPQQAIQLYVQILKKRPGQPQALREMAQVCFEIKRFKLARNLFSRLRKVQPRNITGFYGGACTEFHLGDLANATKLLEEALNIETNHSQSLMLLCEIFVLKKQYDKALVINNMHDISKPMSSDILLQRGLLLLQLGEISAAQNALKTSFELTPHLFEARSNYLQSLLYNPAMTNEDLKKEHMAAMQYTPSTPLKRLHSDQKCRIAYISADFLDHPTANCLLPLFRNHNKKDFELILISRNQQADHVTEECKQLADQFIEIHSKNPIVIERKLRELNLDVCIDTISHTGPHLLDVLSQRIAPVQMSMLGYPGTSGSTNIDFAVVDKHTVPDPSYSYFSEDLLYQAPIFACFHQPNL